jgi:hypothetical protein
VDLDSDKMYLPKFSPTTPPHPYRLSLGRELETSLDIHDIESLSRHRSQKRGSIPQRLSEAFKPQTKAGKGSGDFDLVALRSQSALLNGLETVEHPSATDSAPSHLSPQKLQKKRRLKWALFIFIILVLLGDLIFLNVRAISKQNTSSSPVPTFAPTAPSSGAIEECLSQYAIDAPSNPSAYPCSTCLPILSQVTNNSNATEAAQFCGLRAILESTGTTGNTALSNGGWGKDLRVCIWSGVSCSDSGLVTSL